MVSGGGWPNWTIYGPQRSLDCTNNDCDGKCNFWPNLRECSKMLSAFSSMPDFQSPSWSLTFNGQSLLVMKSSCFQTVAQRSIWWPNWTIHGQKFVQLMFNTIRTAFSSLKRFQTSFSLSIVMLSSCSQKVAKANPGWNQLRRTGKSSTGLQLLSAETPPVSKSTFSSWPSYYQKAASFSKSCKGQFRKPIE